MAERLFLVLALPVCVLATFLMLAIGLILVIPAGILMGIIFILDPSIDIFRAPEVFFGATFAPMEWWLDRVGKVAV